MIGAVNPDEKIPSFILNSKYILSLDTNPETGRKYGDGSCIFRAISLFEKRKMNPKAKNVELRTAELLQAYTKKWKVKNFSGVPIRCLSRVELLCKIRLSIFHLTQRPGDGKICATPIYISEAAGAKPWPKISLCTWGSKEKATGNLLHSGLATNLEKLVKSFHCEICDSLFERADALIRHRREVDCRQGASGFLEDSNLKPEEKFSNSRPVGGGFLVPRNVYSALFRAGIINIRPEEKVKRGFLFFDMECYSVGLNLSISAQQDYIDRLIPVCASMSTCGVDGYSEVEGVCIVERHDCAKLIERMLIHILEVADAWYAQTRPRYQYIFDQLTLLIAQNHADSKLCQYYQKLETQLTNWIRTFPVFGWSSSRFDLALIRKWFLPKLAELDSIEGPGGPIQIIKRGNAYLKVRLS